MKRWRKLAGSGFKCDNCGSIGNLLATWQFEPTKLRLCGACKAKLAQCTRTAYRKSLQENEQQRKEKTRQASRTGLSFT